MKKYLFIIIILSYLPTALYANNIGLCGGPNFLPRQKIIDNLVLQLKQNPTNQIIKNEIIQKFGNMGIENLIRYKEPCLKNIFLTLLKYPDFYVQYKSLYALRNSGNLEFNKLQYILNSTNLLLKDMLISSLTENNIDTDTNIIKAFINIETNIYLKNALFYAFTNIKGKKKKIFPDFNYEIKRTVLTNYKYYKSGSPIENYQEKYSQIFLPDNHLLQKAEHFIPPIINYKHELLFSGNRISFNVGGGEIKHAGDDCGWFREGTSVFAIGNGIVRLIHHSPDWGFLIVIEHQITDTEYVCSIYGHLSKEIYIYPGKIVHEGEKIGTIGLSYSIENGGYGAHLHFAISKGRWLKSKYNAAEDLAIIQNDKQQKVKEYQVTQKGITLIFENGLSLTLTEEGSRLNDMLFWLKGYAFSKDLDRIWLDPQEFLEQHQ